MAQSTATNDAIMEDDINGTNSNWDADTDTGQDVDHCYRSQKPNEINWLTNDLTKTLDEHAPSTEEGFSANEQVDNSGLVC